MFFDVDTGLGFADAVSLNDGFMCVVRDRFDLKVCFCFIDYSFVCFSLSLSSFLSLSVRLRLSFKASFIFGFSFNFKLSFLSKCGQVIAGEGW